MCVRCTEEQKAHQCNERLFKHTLYKQGQLCLDSDQQNKKLLMAVCSSLLFLRYVLYRTVYPVKQRMYPRPVTG